MKYTFLCLMLFIGHLGGNNIVFKTEKIKGLSFVAPPSEFSKNPMPAIQAINANWIAVLPFGFSYKNSTKISYNAKWQWWGEKPEGVKKTIQMAKKANLKVMLKPQIYVSGSWTGAIGFKDETDWKKWEKSYETFILPFATIAADYRVELFCIGTELKIVEKERPLFWKKLIKKIRTIYKGKLTYAANWDSYENVSFWEDLDYIGVDAYFPLIDAKTPTVNELKKAWKPIVQKLKQFHKKFEKQIIFTEFGYLTVDGCAYKHWEIEPKVRDIPINEQAQANAIQAIYDSFWEETWWAGSFIWKWFPNGQGHEGYVPRDYTPQGKKSLDVLKKRFEE